jgi:hypothetical protein
MLRALWAAAAGDSASARSAMRSVDLSSARNRAVLGDGPALVEGLIAARGARWAELVGRLGAAARTGEHDPTFLDRPDSFLTRWLVASAYERLGRLDSASAYFAMMLRPTRMPPGHYALRGIPSGFTHRRLAELADRQGDRAASIRHHEAFVNAFQRPDEVTRPLVVSARARRTTALPGIRHPGHAGGGQGVLDVPRTVAAAFSPSRR